MLDGKKKRPYKVSRINLIAVFSSPAIKTSLKAGTTAKFLPEGAKKPRAIATALIA